MPSTSPCGPVGEAPPPACGAAVCLEGDHHRTEGAAPLLTATAGDLGPCLPATHPSLPPGQESGVIMEGGGGQHSRSLGTGRSSGRETPEVEGLAHCEPPGGGRDGLAGNECVFTVLLQQGLPSYAALKPRDSNHGHSGLLLTCPCLLWWDGSGRGLALSYGGRGSLSHSHRGRRLWMEHKVRTRHRRGAGGLSPLSDQLLVSAQVVRSSPVSGSELSGESA